jgi:DNA-binding CsgD family transcriptional regulator
MYSAEIESLARHLIGTELPSSELCKFLVIDTFARFEASAICLLGISDDGHLHSQSSFGIPKEVITQLGTVQLSSEIPLITSFRNNQVVVIAREHALELFPELNAGAGMPSSVQSLLLCPILPYGGFALVLSREVHLDTELEAFFRAVGTVAALHFNHLQPAGQLGKTKKEKHTSSKNVNLTERQILIKKLMENGFTNVQIANEIGYSESLVRQETMAIYTILKIDGRRELLEISGGR